MKQPNKGDRFHKLVAVSRSHRDRHGNVYWLFKCDCGNEKSIQLAGIGRGRVKSCGCYRKSKPVTHGVTSHPKGGNVNRFSICFLVLALSIAGTSRVLAQDRVIMKNGDVITGNISVIDGEDVFMEPSYADEFALDLAEVATIELAEAFEVELADKTKSDAAMLTINNEGEQVLVIDGVERPVDLMQITEASEPEEYFDWGANVD